MKASLLVGVSVGLCLVVAVARPYVLRAQPVGAPAFKCYGQIDATKATAQPGVILSGGAIGFHVCENRPVSDNVIGFGKMRAYILGNRTIVDAPINQEIVLGRVFVTVTPIGSVPSQVSAEVIDNPSQGGRFVRFALATPSRFYYSITHVPN